jgi:hypothetical protein
VTLRLRGDAPIADSGRLVMFADVELRTRRTTGSETVGSVLMKIS